MMTSEYLILLYGETYNLLKGDLQKYFSQKDFVLEKKLTTMHDSYQSPLARRILPVDIKLKKESTCQSVILKKYEQKFLENRNEKDYQRKVLLANWSPATDERLLQFLSPIKENFSGEVAIRVTQAYKPETKLQLKCQFRDVSILRDDKELFAFFDELFDI